MQLTKLSILIKNADSSESLHTDIMLKNADDLAAEREAVRRAVKPTEQPYAFLTLKAWAACVRLKITNEAYQEFRKRIVDFDVEQVEVDPTQLAGGTTSHSPSPASTAPSSSGSPALEVTTT